MGVAEGRGGEGERVQLWVISNNHSPPAGKEAECEYPFFFPFPVRSHLANAV